MNINKKIILKFNEMLNLSATGNEQDWALEVADKGRILEFIEIFKKGVFLSDEKYAFMSLILSSYDDYLNYTEDNNNLIWREIVDLLNCDKYNYIELLNYWALWNEKDITDVFKITSLVREYLANLKNE